MGEIEYFDIAPSGASIRCALTPRAGLDFAAAGV